MTMRAKNVKVYIENSCFINLPLLQFSAFKNIKFEDLFF